MMKLWIMNLWWKRGEEEKEGSTKMRGNGADWVSLSLWGREREPKRAFGGELAAAMSSGAMRFVLMARGTLRRWKDVKDMFLYVEIGDNAVLAGRSSNWKESEFLFG
jgi:hypothetical protein